MAERIVVVGHAAVTCLGRDIDSTWAGLIAGRRGVRRHDAFDRDRYLTDLFGDVEDVEPGDETPDKLDVRAIRLALDAARAAWADARLDGAGSGLDRGRVAVVVGSAQGGLDLFGAACEDAEERGRLETDHHLIPGMLVNQLAGQIAQALGLHGPGFAPANACATGGHAIALGGILLRSGEADIALCGAGDSVRSRLFINGLGTIRALHRPRHDDRAADDPGQASRPFSVDRAGFVLSEGAGMVVLATAEAARRLGLTIQAELASWALNSDGFHMTRPHGARIADCLDSALKRAEVAPERVDYYNAHGTSTPINDRVETAALKAVFGRSAMRLPVSSIKGALGHSQGSASAIEAAVCVRALREQVIPPTVNYRPDPELDLDYVPDFARPARLETILSASFGFGGMNNALVFRRWSDD